MKKIIILVFVSLSTNMLHSQWLGSFIRSATSNSNVYKTKVSFNLIQTYQISSGTAINSPTVFTIDIASFPANYVRYTILEENDNGIWIKILPCVRFRTGSTNVIEYDPICAGSGIGSPSDYYFMIDPDDICPNNHYLATEKLVGEPITMPIKLRSLDKNPEINVDMSLGYAFGWRIKADNNPYRKRYFNVIPFAFSVNKESYFYKTGVDPNTNENTYSTPTDAVSLTYYSFGATYEVRKFNIGFFMGWDSMLGSNSNWVYQKQRWFSIGLGYKFGGDD